MIRVGGEEGIRANWIHKWINKWMVSVIAYWSPVVGLQSGLAKMWWEQRDFGRGSLSKHLNVDCQDVELIKSSLTSGSIAVLKFSIEWSLSYVYTPVGLFPTISFPSAIGIRAANRAASLNIEFQDYGDRRPGPGYPSGPMIVDSELFLKLLAGSICKVVCNGNFSPLKSLLI